MIRTAAVLLLCLLATPGCEDITAFAGADGVELRVMNLGVEIGNNRTQPIYYFVVERTTAARISWTLCEDPAECRSVAPGRREGVNGHDIPGWGESEEVILYWWHLVPRSDGTFRADSVRSLIGAVH